MNDAMRLARDLDFAAELARPLAEKVVKKAAVNVKAAWRENSAEAMGAYGRRFPASIGYDNLSTGRNVKFVVGPDKDKPQGALGVFDEFGSVNNPPHHSGRRAADQEAPKFEAAMDAVADELVRRVGRG